jgi:hypothetical protein
MTIKTNFTNLTGVKKVASIGGNGKLAVIPLEVKGITIKDDDLIKKENGYFIGVLYAYIIGEEFTEVTEVCAVFKPHYFSAKWGLKIGDYVIPEDEELTREIIGSVIDSMDEEDERRDILITVKENY